MHLLYSRFWHKFLNDIDMVPGKEPYQARRQHGVILGEDDSRMSKSRGNIINPEDIVKKFGADTLRVYLMFMGPYEATMPWNTKGTEGAYRFLTRIWRLFQDKNKVGQKTSTKLEGELHRLIKRVGEDIENLKHNTAIAGLMEFLNHWSEESLSKEDAGIFLQLLAPFAPYLAEELWCEGLKNKFSIHQQAWPSYDPKLVKAETVIIPVQINGKVRGQVTLAQAKAKQEAEAVKLAKEEENVAKHLKGKKIKKTVFIPAKLLNFVVSP